MWRTVLVLAAVAIAGWLLLDWLFTSDEERVEARIEALAAQAREGGPAAAGAILDALAADYRGTRPFDRETIASYLKRYVTPGKLRRLALGSFQVIWAGDELMIPMIRIDVDAGRLAGTLLLTVHFVEENGEWRISKVSRARLLGG